MGWIAGSRVGKCIQWSENATTTYFLISSGGHIDLMRQSVRPMTAAAPSITGISFSTTKVDEIAALRNGRKVASTTIDRRKVPGQFMGFRLKTISSIYSWGGANLAARFQIFSVPYWCLMSLTAVLAAAAITRLNIRGSLKGEFCSQCGYDLRATLERCPECGTPRDKLQSGG